jgi:hypothetical protein
MAMSAEQILLLTVPVAGSLTVDTDFPVAKLVAVTLAAKPIRFGEWDDLPGNQAQAVSVIEIVTVKAPTLSLGMVEDNVVVHVHQFTSFRVRFHVCVAVGTGENVF